MTDMRISGLVFDRGIDSITYAQQDAQPTLPERGESAPPDVGARAQLSALPDLAVPTKSGKTGPL